MDSIAAICWVRITLRTLRFFSVTHLVSCWQDYCVFRFLSLCLPENFFWALSVFFFGSLNPLLVLMLLFYVLYLFFLFCDRFLCCTLLFHGTGCAILFHTMGDTSEASVSHSWRKQGVGLWLAFPAHVEYYKKRNPSLGKICDFDIFMWVIKQFH